MPTPTNDFQAMAASERGPTRKWIAANPFMAMAITFVVANLIGVFLHV